MITLHLPPGTDSSLVLTSISNDKISIPKVYVMLNLDVNNDSFTKISILSQI